MMNDSWRAPLGTRGSKSCPCSPIKPLIRTRSESSHVTHKVPAGDTPYVKAKRVQLVDKDPERAIPLFWAAINAGDRVDSALKDMAIVMKQANRAEEAIEAIKSLRNRCSDQAQESLDNILLDLYKRCGRLDDQISLLKHKLCLIHQGMAFNGKQTKTARSQGKKFQVSVEQETTRLLGNLGWAFMQQQNYVEAESAYRKALLIASDNNKMCNLGICLMKQGRVAEAKETLQRVKPAMADGPRGVDSHLKAYERAQEMLRDLESKSINGYDRFLESFLGSSSVWQPQPCAPFSSDAVACKDSINPVGVRGGFSSENFGDENFNINTMNRIGLDSMQWKDPINPSFMKGGFGVPDLCFSENQQEDFADENFNVNIMSRGGLKDNQARPPLQKSMKPGVLSFMKVGFGVQDLCYSENQQEDFADENLNVNIMSRGGLNDNQALPPLQKSMKPGVLSFMKAGFGVPDLCYSENQQEDFADENFSINTMSRGGLKDNQALPPLQKSMKPGVLFTSNSLNIDAPPFYSKLLKNQIDSVLPDPLCKLKRTRSVTSDIISVQEKEKVAKPISEESEHQDRRRRSESLDSEENGENLIDLLPDCKEFEEMFIAAAIAPFVEIQNNPAGCHKNIKKRLNFFQDITLPLSPKI